MNLEEIINAAVEKRVHEILSDYAVSAGPDAYDKVRERFEKVMEDELDKREPEIRELIKQRMEHLKMKVSARNFFYNLEMTE